MAEPVFLPRLLGMSDEQLDHDTITTDEAIEIRNRKEERLCLFVPTDLVDAAVSSLMNSFAPIDGRALHEEALGRLLRLLSSEARFIMQAVFRQLRPRYGQATIRNSISRPPFEISMKRGSSGVLDSSCGELA